MCYFDLYFLYGLVLKLVSNSCVKYNIASAFSVSIYVIKYVDTFFSNLDRKEGNSNEISKL
jgi:hypothetical protein